MTKTNKTKFYVEYFFILSENAFSINEFKQTIARILYTYRLNAIAKYWYLKMEEGENFPKKNSTVFFNRRLSVAEKLKWLNMQMNEVFHLHLITLEFQDLK